MKHKGFNMNTQMKTNISTELSDVLFNMTKWLNMMTGKYEEVPENAEMLIHLLQSYGIKDLPTVNDLLEDFYSRL